MKYAWHLSIRNGKYKMEMRKIDNNDSYVLIPSEHLRRVLKYLRGNK